MAVVATVCQWFDSNLWLWGDNIWHEVVKSRFWTEFPHRVTRRDFRVVTIRILSIHSTSTSVSTIKLCWHATTNCFAIGVWSSSSRRQVKANYHLSCSTGLQGAMIANISKSARIVSVSMSVVLLQSPLIPIYPPGLFDFWGIWALLAVPSPAHKCQVLPVPRYRWEKCTHRCN